MQTTGGTVIGGSLDQGWYSAVNRFAVHTPWLHGAARLFANDGIVLFVLLLLVSFWFARRSGSLARVTAAIAAPFGVLVALGLNQLVGRAVDEPRPYAVLPHALVLVSRTTDPSFPSDHAVMAGAVAAGVWVAGRRLGVVAVALALVMAATRVYVGAHFPLDVVAGLLLGAVVALAWYAAVRRVTLRAATHLTRTRLRRYVVTS
ncbi:MAG: phosphatase PAP2 family protein [Promicromonosporaceae bacterium]|nr:phosphatase PAP2 family protein [Promicromonosporaceae bacterium]